MKGKTNRFAAAVLLASSVVLNSCATYHLTTQSMLEQFANSQPEKKKTYILVFPFVFFPGTVTGNSLREIEVLDAHENQQVLPITNRTGVRIIKKDGTRTTFYFNTLLIQDSTITGKKDHFFGTNIKPIKLNNIQKIEIQK